MTTPYQPSQVSKQEMVELLQILSGEKQTIINPEMLMEDGKLFETVDIYGLAAVVNGLKTLIERSHEENKQRTLSLAELLTSVVGELEKRLDALDEEVGL